MKHIWEGVSFVRRSRYRRAVLRALEEPKMPTDLAQELHIHLSHASRALIELEGKGLVECLTPNERKGRLYRRTVAGNRVGQHIKPKS